MDDNETLVINPATGGGKGSKVQRYDLIPWDQMDKVAEVYGKGVEKYAARNWELGYDWSLSIAALHRHLAAFVGKREEIDKPTGCYHMAQVIFHAFALMRFAETHPELDDRAVISNVRDNRY